MKPKGKKKEREKEREEGGEEKERKGKGKEKESNIGNISLFHCFDSSQRWALTWIHKPNKSLPLPSSFLSECFILFSNKKETRTPHNVSLTPYSLQLRWSINFLERSFILLPMRVFFSFSSQIIVFIYNTLVNVNLSIIYFVRLYKYQENNIFP